VLSEQFHGFRHPPTFGEKRLYGLSTEDVRRLVYVFCEQNNINHSFSQEKRLEESGFLDISVGIRSYL